MRVTRSRLAWLSSTLLVVACVTEGPPESGKGDTPGASRIEVERALGCKGLACNVKSCGDPQGTTISGTVYAPNGTLPIYNAQVFIPNGPLAPISHGVGCNACGAPLSGDPITVATTDASGHFALLNAPSGKDIPLVVQLGKWQRVTTIPSVAACTNTNITDPDLTRLPKNQSEGSMPHIALTTGGCDQMGCVLPKLGIDDKEFGYEADGYAKAINTYLGEDFTLGLPATAADHLWKSPPLLSTYDMALFSCECSEALTSKGGSITAPEFGVVTDYMNAGGRILTTDFQYTWYKYSPDPTLGGSPVGSDTIAIGKIVGGAPLGGDPISIDTSFTGGKALADWLLGAFPGSAYAEVTPDYVFSNVQHINKKGVTWASSPTPTGPRIFTVSTPVGAAGHCGQGTHIDAHVEQDSSDTVSCETLADGGTGACYPKTCKNPLTEGEAMVAFYFFNMSSCVP